MRCAELSWRPSQPAAARVWLWVGAASAAPGVARTTVGTAISAAARSRRRRCVVGWWVVVRDDTGCPFTGAIRDGPRRSCRNDVAPDATDRAGGGGCGRGAPGLRP